MCDRRKGTDGSGHGGGGILVEPIGPAQREQVIAATEACLTQAGSIFNRTFAPIPVRFDLRGRSAGQYRRDARGPCIRYNPHIFAKHFDDNLTVTVPHEVAHYVTDCIYGLRRIRPHGAEWRALMQALGADASRAFSYSLDGVPVHGQRRHAYRCGCSSHQLSSSRHNRIRRGQSRYLCRCCGEALVPFET